MRRKERFIETKMLSARVEKIDHWKLEDCLNRDNLTIQQWLNSMVRSYVSGNIVFSGSVFYSK